MCVIIIAWQVHPEYPLVYISNRDEYFSRKTLAAARWTDAPHVFGGRDEERGGTWLGISDSGKIAAVTNYRDGPLNDKLVSPESRGELTSNWLIKDDSSSCSAEEYLKAIDGQCFDGYNIIVGNVKEGLWYSSNWADNGAVHRLSAGIHGISNHYMDAPGWPKVDTAKKQLKALLDDTTTLDEDDLIEKLFDILRNDTMYDDGELPDTGIDVNIEKLFSSMFVKADEFDYGTRACTVILTRKNGHVHFLERTFGRDHKLEKQSEHRINLPNDDQQR
jgi:uncharacterized protein with NRDE domain